MPSRSMVSSGAPGDARLPGSTILLITTPEKGAESFA